MSPLGLACIIGAALIAVAIFVVPEPAALVVAFIGGTTLGTSGGTLIGRSLVDRLYR